MAALPDLPPPRRSRQEEHRLGAPTTVGRGCKLLHRPKHLPILVLRTLSVEALMPMFLGTRGRAAPPQELVLVWLPGFQGALGRTLKMNLHQMPVAIIRNVPSTMFLQACSCLQLLEALDS